MPLWPQPILLSGPDHALLAWLSRQLLAHGFRTLCSSTGVETLQLLSQQSVALVILNLDSGDSDAVALCRSIRQACSAPILALVAQPGPAAVVSALRLGADDCLCLPLHLEELLARIEALLRRDHRAAGPAAASLHDDGLVIDCEQRRLLRDGRPVHLTATEWALLQELVRHAGSVVTHRMLLQRIWGPAYGDENNYLYAYMRRLRCKLERDPANPVYLLTEAGLGYRFMLPAHERRQPHSSARGLAQHSPLLACSSLPTPPNPIIGREAELAAAQAQLQRQAVRLLTLTGPGGAGKTRLAIELAARLAPQLEHGVCFVDLAPIQDPALVPAAIAGALRAAQQPGEQPGQSLLDSLLAYLRPRQLLLVLDNFEQLLAAAPLVAQLLRGAPRLQLLVTSRAALHLSGEHEFPVPPLALPEPTASPSAAALAQVPALALFVDRARAVRPAFAVSDANATLIAEICRQLDGLPLAIELAASSCRYLTPPALLARLSSRLALLTEGPRDLPARQQTLRATIDWSYRLLSAEEQLLFARLGIFSAGCTLQAALEVAGQPAYQALPATAHAAALEGPAQGCAAELDRERLLAALVDKSMLRRVERCEDLAPAGHPEPRFVMLETLREYALERLAELGELQALRQRHAEYFLALAERAEPELLGTEQAIWLTRLEQEQHNLRLAFGWAAAGAAPLLALRLCGALWRFWYARGYVREGRQWLQAALSCSREVPPQLLARVLRGAGVLAFSQDDYAEARSCFEESLQLQHQLGDSECMAQSMANLGLIAYWQGDYDRSLALLEPALEHFERLGDRCGTAGTLLYVGMAHFNLGHAALAWQLQAQALALYQELGHTTGIGTALTWLGRLALLQDDYARAAQLLEQGLALLRPLAHRAGSARALAYLGRLTLLRGAAAEAAPLLRESLRLFCELGDREGQATALESLAGVTAAQGSDILAARLWGAAEALRQRIGAPLAPAERLQYQRLLALACPARDAAGFQAAWDEGRALPPEHGIALALSSESTASTAAPGAAGS